MKVAITCERDTHETRVAVSPDTVKRLVGLGIDVTVETRAGARALMTDEQYAEAGAQIATSLEDALSGAKMVFKVGPPVAEELDLIAPGGMLIGMLSPYGDRERLADYAARGIDAFAMELMPRISRAQSMDVLSSQSNLAGYKAVIDAAALFGRGMPMMMTAAGTIAPARVFVLGAGVAGLQAIATARRMGAIVSATDVRPPVKEQVESLGATFVMVDSQETREAETAGGYAKEMSEDYKLKQAALVEQTVMKQDIVICTALIPGRAAPTLVSQAMVESMKPGSIIVDLAVEHGGNCPLSRVGEVVEHAGVLIMGHRNVPGRLPVDASSLYARNLFNFVSTYADKDAGEINLDWNDELVIGTGLTRAGEIVHPSFTQEA
ncbi:MAG: NAD(P) transhydrogenase subunit alpha [Gammaproteobacteria bacterium]|jgi:NAD(P) transhydrogenase subunit alpha